MRHTLEVSKKRLAAQEGKDRKYAEQLEHDRIQQERTKKKVAFLSEARCRAVVLFQTRSLSLLQRIHVIDEILTPLDAALTGNESLSEAYASVEAVLKARLTDWEAEDAAKAAKEQKEWMEFAVVILVIIAGGFTFVKAPAALAIQYVLLQTRRQHWGPQEANRRAPNPSSDEPTPVRRVKKIRRPLQSPGPPQSPSLSDNPFPSL